MSPRRAAFGRRLALHGAARQGTRGSGADAQELLRGPNLPSPRLPGAGAGPGVRVRRALGEALRCGAMYGVSLCVMRRSAALLAPHQVSSGRRKGDTAHSPAERGSLTLERAESG